MLSDLLQGLGNGMTFQVNGHEYNHYYLLADMIYYLVELFFAAHSCPTRREMGALY